MLKDRRPFYVFDDYQNGTWTILFERAMPRVRRRASRLYLEGQRNLGLTPEHIPNFEQMNEWFKENVGWELVSTDVQYSDGQTWFEHLVRREFLITEYIRERDSLDYTPLPDIFHDAFGHLPWMSHRWYADLVLDFARVMLAADPEDRPGLGSIWWYTIEFGLIREDGEVKAFGAGLMSSYEEIEVAFSDRVERLPFDPQTIAPVKPSPHELHKKLWILDSVEQLEDFVAQQKEKYGIR